VQNRWVSDPDDGAPSIAVDLGGVFLLRGVSCTLGPVPISNYRLHYRVGHGAWQELSPPVTENVQLSLLHDDFELVLADSVRLSTVDRIKLYELEVWGERYDVGRGDVLRSMEYSQRFFAAVDPVGQYGNLYRCRLANGEQRWLCPYHASHAKGTVELERPAPLRTVGELATERLVRMAKAAVVSRRSPLIPTPSILAIYP
jgi:hypothetical protein